IDEWLKIGVVNKALESVLNVLFAADTSSLNPELIKVKQKMEEMPIRFRDGNLELKRKITLKQYLNELGFENKAAVLGYFKDMVDSLPSKQKIEGKDLKALYLMFALYNMISFPTGDILPKNLVTKEGLTVFAGNCAVQTLGFSNWAKSFVSPANAALAEEIFTTASSPYHIFNAVRTDLSDKDNPTKIIGADFANKHIPVASISWLRDVFYQGRELVLDNDPRQAMIINASYLLAESTGNLDASKRMLISGGVMQSGQSLELDYKGFKIGDKLYTPFLGRKQESLAVIGMSEAGLKYGLRRDDLGLSQYTDPDGNSFVAASNGTKILGAKDNNKIIHVLGVGNLVYIRRKIGNEDGYVGVYALVTKDGRVFSSEDKDGITQIYNIFKDNLQNPLSDLPANFFKDYNLKDGRILSADNFKEALEGMFPPLTTGGATPLSNRVSGILEGAIGGVAAVSLIPGVNVISWTGLAVIGGAVALGGVAGKSNINNIWGGLMEMVNARSAGDWLNSVLFNEEGVTKGKDIYLLSSAGGGWVDCRRRENDRMVIYRNEKGELVLGFLDDTQARGLINENIAKAGSNEEKEYYENLLNYQKDLDKYTSGEAFLRVVPAVIIAGSGIYNLASGTPKMILPKVLSVSPKVLYMGGTAAGAAVFPMFTKDGYTLKNVACGAGMGLGLAASLHFDGLFMRLIALESFKGVIASSQLALTAAGYAGAVAGGNLLSTAALKYGLTSKGLTWSDAGTSLAISAGTLAVSGLAANNAGTDWINIKDNLAKISKGEIQSNMSLWHMYQGRAGLAGLRLSQIYLLAKNYSSLKDPSKQRLLNFGESVSTTMNTYLYAAGWSAATIAPAFISNNKTLLFDLPGMKFLASKPLAGHALYGLATGTSSALTGEFSDPENYKFFSGQGLRDFGLGMAIGTIASLGGAGLDKIGLKKELWSNPYATYVVRAIAAPIALHALGYNQYRESVQRLGLESSGSDYWYNSPQGKIANRLALALSGLNAASGSMMLNGLDRAQAVQKALFMGLGSGAWFSFSGFLAGDSDFNPAIVYDKDFGGRPLIAKEGCLSKNGMLLNFATGSAVGNIMLSVVNLFGYAGKGIYNKLQVYQLPQENRIVPGHNGVSADQLLVNYLREKGGLWRPVAWGIEHTVLAPESIKGLGWSIAMGSGINMTRGFLDASVQGREYFTLKNTSRILSDAAIGGLVASGMEYGFSKMPWFADHHMVSKALTAFVTPVIGGASDSKVIAKILAGEDYNKNGYNSKILDRSVFLGGASAIGVGLMYAPRGLFNSTLKYMMNSTGLGTDKFIAQSILSGPLTFAFNVGPMFLGVQTAYSAAMNALSGKPVMAGLFGYRQTEKGLDPVSFSDAFYSSVIGGFRSGVYQGHVISAFWNPGTIVGDDTFGAALAQRTGFFNRALMLFPENVQNSLAPYFMNDAQNIFLEGTNILASLDGYAMFFFHTELAKRIISEGMRVALPGYSQSLAKMACEDKTLVNSWKDGASRTFREIVKPETIGYWLTLLLPHGPGGMSASTEEQLKEAKKRGDDIIVNRLTDRQVEELFRQGGLQYMQGKLADAEASFKKAYEANGDPETLLKLGEVQREQGKIAAAKKSYYDAAVLTGKKGEKPNEAVNKEARASSLDLKSVEIIRNGGNEKDLQKAKKYLENAIALNPEIPEYDFHLAKVKDKLEMDTQDVINSYREAAKKAHKAEWDLGKIEKKAASEILNKKAEGASDKDKIRFLKISAKINSQDPNVHLKLGEELFNQGNQKDGLESFKKAQQLAPNNDYIKLLIAQAEAGINAKDDVSVDKPVNNDGPVDQAKVAAGRKYSKNITKGEAENNIDPVISKAFVEKEKGRVHEFIVVPSSEKGKFLIQDANNPDAAVPIEMGRAVRNAYKQAMIAARESSNGPALTILKEGAGVGKDGRQFVRIVIVDVDSLPQVDGQKVTAHAGLGKDGKTPSIYVFRTPDRVNSLLGAKYLSPLLVHEAGALDGQIHEYNTLGEEMAKRFVERGPNSANKSFNPNTVEKAARKVLKQQIDLDLVPLRNEFRPVTSADEVRATAEIVAEGKTNSPPVKEDSKDLKAPNDLKHKGSLSDGSPIFEAKKSIPDNSAVKLSTDRQDIVNEAMKKYDEWIMDMMKNSNPTKVAHQRKMVIDLVTGGLLTTGRNAIGKTIVSVMSSLLLSDIDGRNVTVLLQDRKAVDALVKGFDENFQKMSNQDFAKKHGKLFFNVDEYLEKWEKNPNDKAIINEIARAFSNPDVIKVFSRDARGHLPLKSEGIVELSEAIKALKGDVGKAYLLIDEADSVVMADWYYSVSNGVKLLKDNPVLWNIAKEAYALAKKIKIHDHKTDILNNPQLSISSISVKILEDNDYVILVHSQAEFDLLEAKGCKVVYREKDGTANTEPTHLVLSKKVESHFGKDLGYVSSVLEGLTKPLNISGGYGIITKGDKIGDLAVITRGNEQNQDLIVANIAEKVAVLAKIVKSGAADKLGFELVSVEKGDIIITDTSARENPPQEMLKGNDLLVGAMTATPEGASKLLTAKLDLEKGQAWDVSEFPFKEVLDGYSTLKPIWVTRADDGSLQGLERKITKKGKILIGTVNQTESENAMGMLKDKKIDAQHLDSIEIKNHESVKEAAEGKKSVVTSGSGLRQISYKNVLKLILINPQQMPIDDLTQAINRINRDGESYDRVLALEINDTFASISGVIDKLNSLRKAGFEYKPGTEGYLKVMNDISEFASKYKISRAPDLKNINDKSEILKLINDLSVYENNINTSTSHTKAVSSQWMESRITEFLQNLRLTVQDAGDREIIENIIGLVRNGRFSPAYRFDDYKIGSEVLRLMDQSVWKNTNDMLIQLTESLTKAGDKPLTSGTRAYVEAYKDFVEYRISKAGENFSSAMADGAEESNNGWRGQMPEVLKSEALSQDYRDAVDKSTVKATYSPEAFNKINEYHNNSLSVAKKLIPDIMPSNIIETGMSRDSTASFGHKAGDVYKEHGRKQSGDPELPKTGADLFNRTEKGFSGAAKKEAWREYINKYGVIPGTDDLIGGFAEGLAAIQSSSNEERERFSKIVSTFYPDAGIPVLPFGKGIRKRKEEFEKAIPVFMALIDQGIVRRHNAVEDLNFIMTLDSSERLVTGGQIAPAAKEKYVKEARLAYITGDILSTHKALVDNINPGSNGYSPLKQSYEKRVKERQLLLKLGWKPHDEQYKRAMNRIYSVSASEMFGIVDGLGLSLKDLTRKGEFNSIKLGVKDPPLAKSKRQLKREKRGKIESEAGKEQQRKIREQEGTQKKMFDALRLYGAIIPLGFRHEEEIIREAKGVSKLYGKVERRFEKKFADNLTISDYFSRDLMRFILVDLKLDDVRNKSLRDKLDAIKKLNPDNPLSTPMEVINPLNIKDGKLQRVLVEEAKLRRDLIELIAGKVYTNQEYKQILRPAEIMAAGSEYGKGIKIKEIKNGKEEYSEEYSPEYKYRILAYQSMPLLTVLQGPTEMYHSMKGKIPNKDQDNKPINQFEALEHVTSLQGRHEDKYDGKEPHDRRNIIAPSFIDEAVEQFNVSRELFGIASKDKGYDSRVEKRRKLLAVEERLTGNMGIMDVNSVDNIKVDNVSVDYMIRPNRSVHRKFLDFETQVPIVLLEKYTQDKAREYLKGIPGVDVDKVLALLQRINSETKWEGKALNDVPARVLTGFTGGPGDFWLAMQRKALEELEKAVEILNKSRMLEELNRQVSAKGLSRTDKSKAQEINEIKTRIIEARKEQASQVLKDADISDSLKFMFGAKIPFSIDFNKVRSNLSEIIQRQRKMEEEFETVHLFRLIKLHGFDKKEQIVKDAIRGMFEATRGAAMHRKGRARTESRIISQFKGPKHTEYVFRTKWSSLTDREYLDYQIKNEAPHETMHVVLSIITEQDSAFVKELYDSKVLDQLYGKGFTDKMINPDGSLRRDFSYAAEHSDNEMAASVGGMGYLEQFYKKTNDRSLKYVTQDLTGRKDLTFSMLSGMSYQERQDAIEKERQDLVVTSSEISRYKTDEDIKRIRNAGEINKQVFSIVAQLLKLKAEAVKQGIGPKQMSTKELSDMILAEVKKAGGDGFVEFEPGVTISILTSKDIQKIIETIDAQGAEAVGTKMLDKQPNAKNMIDLLGDILRIDFGVQAGKYNSDSRRCFVLGEIKPGNPKYALYQKCQAMYDSSLDLHNTIIKVIVRYRKNGTGFGYGEIDIQTLLGTNNPLAKYYLNKLEWGHGTGLAGHEQKNRKEILMAFKEFLPNQVLTVEPDVVMSPESMILVTDTGAEVLTGAVPQSLDIDEFISAAGGTAKISSSQTGSKEQILTQALKAVLPGAKAVGSEGLPEGRDSDSANEPKSSPMALPVSSTILPAPVLNMIGNVNTLGAVIRNMGSSSAVINPAAVGVLNTEGRIHINNGRSGGFKAGGIRGAAGVCATPRREMIRA
ncbi:MAG: hypothetical protein ABIH18_05980, partial [Candidatus Omnitrophota bacterium]